MKFLNIFKKRKGKEEDVEITLQKKLEQYEMGRAAGVKLSEIWLKRGKKKIVRDLLTNSLNAVDQEPRMSPYDKGFHTGVIISLSDPEFSLSQAFTHIPIPVLGLEEITVYPYEQTFSRLSKTERGAYDSLRRLD